MKNKIAFYFITSLLIISTMMPVACRGKSSHKDLSTKQSGESKNPFPTFYDWKKACDALPWFNGCDNPCKTVLREHMLLTQIDQFFTTMEEQFSKVHWIGGVKPVLQPNQFQAYVEKLMIPADAIVAIHGDFHGDVRAINRFIETFMQRGFLDEANPFKIRAKNFYILFLGDYVDRGWYSAEVIYAILRLKNENPDRVFLMRGHHENAALNARYGGVRDELLQKFSSPRLMKKVEMVYNVLPLALYLGAGSPNDINIIQCCHGGIEIGFDPRPLLNVTNGHAGVCFNILMQEDGFKPLVSIGFSSFGRHFKNNKSIDMVNGFMAGDFIVDSTKPLSLSSRDGYAGTVFKYGKQATEELLKAWSSESYQVRAIFRAHQHSVMGMYDRICNDDKLGHTDDMGVGKLWIENEKHRVTPGLLENIAVVTFSAAPETVYGLPFHAFAELHVAPDYKDWRLYVHQKAWQPQ